MELEYCEICGENIKTMEFMNLDYCDQCYKQYLYEVAIDYNII